MPLKKDAQGGGTEANGSKSTICCSRCYKDGRFITQAKTAKEMQNFVDKIMHDEMKANFIFSWLAKSQIPKLKRWRA